LRIAAAADATRFALFRMFPLLCRVTRKKGGVTRRSRRLFTGDHFRERGRDNIWDKSETESRLIELIALDNT